MVRSVRFGISAFVVLICVFTVPPTGAQQKPGPPGPAAPIPGGPKVVQLPDLVVTLTSTKGFGCTRSGYSVELTVTVKNMGAAVATKPGSGWAAIGVNEAGPWPKEVALLGGPTQLAPGQSVTLKGVADAKVYHPSPYAGDKGVYYRYYAKADPGEAIKEVDEANNVAKYEQQADTPCPGTIR